VWLLTGWLGSGKTTLLKSWLREDALADAALIVNELGEVGLDDRLLAGAADAAALIAGGCVCCTGLPGLEEALSDLFWDRLHRKRPAFTSVVVETTGLADPAPVAQRFEQVELLRERYELAGIVTCVSASAGARMLHSHPEAAAQVAAADVLVVTKTDLADGSALAGALRRANPRAAIATSSQASLAWGEVLELLAAAAHGHGQAHPDPHAHPHAHAHDHDDEHARAEFVACEEPLDLAALQERIGRLRRAGRLLRLKGVVRAEDGSLREVQWSAGDAQARVTALPSSFAAPRLGLTCIYAA
jgi:G3E family GTPase